MNDDLDDELISSDNSFDEFSQDSGASSLRQSPVVKLGVLLAAVAVVGVVIFYFNDTSTDRNTSVLPQGSPVSSAPGTSEEVSPAYRDAVEEQNQEQLQRALREGDSAIPTPIATPDTRLSVPEVEEETEDPLHRWRLLQEERVKTQLKNRDVEVEPVTVLDAEQQSEAINKLSESMIEQMESVLSSNNEGKEFITKTFITYSLEAGNTPGGAGVQGGGTPNGSAASAFEEENEEIVVIAAGSIYYGQLLLEANSDVPSTVLAHIVSGPLKGWKILGEFTVLEDAGMLAIVFNTAVNDAGDQYDVSAVMLNPKTTLPALRTSINNRYFQRVVLPAAAAFVEGFAQAVADSGRTNVTVSGETVIEEEQETTDEQEVASGIEEAGQELSEIIDETSDIPPLIIIKAGTPIGIFFTENVVDNDGDI